MPEGRRPEGTKITRSTPLLHEGEICFRVLSPSDEVVNWVILESNPAAALNLSTQKYANYDPNSPLKMIQNIQIITQNRKKHNSAITRVLLDKKSIWPRFWRFTFFDIGDIFVVKILRLWSYENYQPKSTLKIIENVQITTKNSKNNNSAITRVILDKKSIWSQFWRFIFFDICEFFYSKS